MRVGTRAATLWWMGLLLAVACEEYSSRVVATGLHNAFEITWGPDGQLWVTERTSREVSRVSVAHGSKTTLAVIDEVMVTPGAQDGLLGMALHPELWTARGPDHVFLAYTYDADPAPDQERRRTKIVRFTYDRQTRRLVDPVDLIVGLPGSDDHNSGRLRFGPDRKLYYTIGDQGNNQLANVCRPIRAQELPTAKEIEASDWATYQGKLLRLELDGSIPADNPALKGVRSHVYTYGHRNHQGLAFAPDGKLYGSEHGPKSDDEVNLLERGKNYGWPQVAGFRDDQAYVHASWSASRTPPCEELTFSDFVIPPSVPIQRESAFDHPHFRPPLLTFYTVPDGFDFQDPACAGGDLFLHCWPTIAPSGLEVYAGHSNPLPELDDSLLIPSLKRGAVFQVALDRSGNPLPQHSETTLFHTTNRYRDIAVDPSGRRIFISTDNQGFTMGDDGQPTDALENPGAILEFSRRATPSHANR